MKKMLLILATLALTACGQFDSDDDNATAPVTTPPAPVAPGPVYGLSCKLYDTSALNLAALPSFDIQNSSTVLVGAPVFAGSPVETFMLTGPINYPDAASLTAASIAKPIVGFTMHCTGKFIVEKSALYTFKLTSDDGSRLYISGYNLINNDGSHGATLKSASAVLSAGEHTMTVDIFNGNGPSMLKLESNLPVTLFQ